jgi:hypothetical protein
MRSTATRGWSRRTTRKSILVSPMVRLLTRFSESKRLSIGPDHSTETRFSLSVVEVSLIPQSS